MPSGDIVAANREELVDGEAVGRRSRVPSPRVRAVAYGLLSAAVALGAWWALSAADVWSELIFPGPGKVWNAFTYSLSSHDGRPGYFGAYLWEHAWASVWRILNGVGRAILVGVPLGIAIALWRPVAALVEPWVNFLRSLPPLAYFVLLIFWFGIGDEAKVWLLFGAAFPPITLATITGVHRVRTDRINAALSLGASRLQVVRHTILPSILPDLLTGLRVAVGFSWTTIVAAETVNGLPGLGGVAWATRSQNRADIALMCVIVIGLLAIAMDQIIKAVERLTVPWARRGMA